MQNNFLDKIIRKKKEEINILKKKGVCVERFSFKRRRLKEMIREDRVNIIAETKRMSPSRGILVKNYNPVRIAEYYQNLGAVGVSVLTERYFFGGKLSDLMEVKKSVDIPVLRKDFIMDEIQIYESFLAGADIILLIAKIASLSKLRRLYECAHKEGMEVILEIFDEEDLKKALKIDAQFIGINNRNLKTFKIDFNHTLNLIEKIPSHKTIIVESGLHSRKDLEIFLKKNVKVFLIGERFLLASCKRRVFENFLKAKV